MKLLTLLLLAACIHAAPITFTSTGSATFIPGGYFITTADYPGTAQDQFAAFKSSEPLTSVSFYLDNYPNGVGPGQIIKLDGITVYNTGAWVPVQQWFTFTAAQVGLVSFSSIGFYVNVIDVNQIERSNVLELTGVGVPKKDLSSVPELGALGMVGIGLLLIAARRGK